jgi:hypothetical protein
MEGCALGAIMPNSVNIEDFAKVIKDINGVEMVYLENNGELHCVGTKAQYEEMLPILKKYINRLIPLFEDFGAELEEIAKKYRQ